MGTAYYLRKSSIAVEQDEPPIRIIAAEVYIIDGDADRGNTTVSSILPVRFRYKMDTVEMYAPDESGGWRLINPAGSWAETGVIMPTGEMIFYVTYGEKFYGKRKLHSDYSGEYDIFSDDFYAKAN